MSKKHYFELDYMNVVLCLMVVFIHVSGKIINMMTPDTATFIGSKAVLRDLAFVVQGFLFLSGLKLTQAYKSKKFKYFEFLGRRMTKVLIPYVIAVLIYSGYFYYKGFIELNHDTIVYDILLGNISAQFYFVIALLQFYLLMPLWILVSKINKPIFMFSLSVIIYSAFIYFLVYNKDFTYYDRVFVNYLPFWILGCGAGNNYEKFKSSCEKKIGVITGMFVFFAVLDGIVFCILERMHLDGLYSNFVHLLFCIFSVLFLFTASASLPTKNKLSFFTGAINDLSYEIYLYHCLLLVFVDMFIEKLKVPFVNQYFLLRLLITYSIIIFVAIVVKIFRKILKR